MARVFSVSPGILKNASLIFFRGDKALLLPFFDSRRCRTTKNDAERERNATPATANTAHLRRKKKKERKNVATKSMAADRQRERVESFFSG